MLSVQQIFNRLFQSDDDKLAVAVDAAALPPTDVVTVSSDTGLVADTAVEVDWSATLTSKTLYIRNDSETTAVSVSLDGATTWFSLAAKQSVDLACRRGSCHIKSTGISIPVTVLVGGDV